MSAKDHTPRSRRQEHRRGGAGDRRGGDRERPGRVSRARLVAYRVLRDVNEREAYANLALVSRLRDARLTGRDAALATELAAGTLRWRGRYDRVIALAAQRDVTEIDPRTLDILRLGTHQLLGMRTAAHAAVHESVELQRAEVSPRGAGFVNGVLRAIGRAAPDEWDERLRADATDPDDARAALSSHPAWVVRAFRDALRAEDRVDELDALLASDNRSPRVSLAVLPGSDIDDDSVLALGGEYDLERAGPSPLGFEIGHGDPAHVIEALGQPDGLVRVQDQGSQLAALALTRVRESSGGEAWLDLCAGPGGKTAILAAEAERTGASVRANEVSEHRARLVESAVSASAHVVRVVNFDGRNVEAYGEPGRRFSRILLDAPCSGLGALRRRPEARWRKQPQDLPQLSDLQAELLATAAEHLEPGGVLAYVTCSPHLSETRLVIDRFLREQGAFRELDAKAVVQSLAREPLDLAGSALSAQLWPHRNGTDAMFIALLERVIA